MDKYHIEKDIAQYIKREVSTAHLYPNTQLIAHNPQFDSRKGATWHCVVGRNFGSFVTHGE
ncbi:dynein light chain type 1 [Aspergillus luchuensis]|uniref:Dynein light chain n=1 Tax=Aspergillus kawachii TaxID=1069201 RepID=A0A146FP89_ASPKA|nr:dynein light chain type 1 [Aspergillus luchuensis]